MPPAVRELVAGERACRRPVRELASLIGYGGFEEIRRKMMIKKAK
jgi:hypothetical protein